MDGSSCMRSQRVVSRALVFFSLVSFHDPATTNHHPRHGCHPLLTLCCTPKKNTKKNIYINSVVTHCACCQPHTVPLITNLIPPLAPLAPPPTPSARPRALARHRPKVPMIQSAAPMAGVLATNATSVQYYDEHGQVPFCVPLLLDARFFFFFFFLFFFLFFFSTVTV